MRDGDTHILQFHSFSLFLFSSSSSSHPRSFKAASLPLYILGKSLSELEKGPWGHKRRVRFLFFFSFSLWIIDSRCLVIHRLHMLANSSGEEKLPTSQPCMPHRPNTPQTHTHTHNSCLHTPQPRIYACTHTQTKTHTHHSGLSSALSTTITTTPTYPRRARSLE